MQISQIPVFLYWLYFGIRARDLFFFSNVNPVIETGGMMGESKINILNRLPKNILPVTLFFEANTPLENILKEIATVQLTYPIIAKPDIGERGFFVSKLESEEELQEYVKKNKGNFLIQEFVDFPLEISVLYYRFPNQNKGKVTSVCIKETLKVTGDGKSSVKTLMQNYDRASLQLERFEKEKPKLLEMIPAKGETIELEPIGNHCRGTMFLNGNEFIDERLEQVFNKVSLQTDHIFYGRFDMKCQNMEDLKNEGVFKVMEFNGIAGEPAHIYDPKYPVWKAYRDVFRHWKIIYQISQIQKQKGVKSMTFKEAKDSVNGYFAYMKKMRL